ncbi:hypothetical protein DFH28DRAFT_895124, partial [Melampsora americana]
EPQSTTTFALQQEKDDLEDEYVMIGKLTPDLMNSMIRPQSSRRLYSKKKLQANELIDPEVEDYIYVDRKQIPEYHSKTDVKIIQSNLEKGQSSQSIARESKEENRLNEGKRYKSAKLKEQVQEKSYKSALTQEVKAGNEKQEVVKEELDSMWFWNEGIDDQGRLEDIQDDLKKILVDYKKIKPANHNGSKKQEKMNPPLVIFGIKIGGNLNRLPPDHKVNRKLSRVA